MPSFEFLDKVEHFVRTGTLPGDSTKSSKKVTKAASKHFLYKDGVLWRMYRGRLLRVVRSNEEVREILIRFHDNNHHIGRVRMLKQIMSMYYWVGVTEAVKNWISACPLCQSRTATERDKMPARYCLAYGCDTSSYSHPDLQFHRFPKDAEQRTRWLAVAQRDEGSLRTNSCLCSRHFEPSCFILNEEGQLTLAPDAVPTIISVTALEDEVSAPSDEEFLHSNTLEEFLSTCDVVQTSESSDVGSERPVQLLEHQYCLPSPDPNSRTFQTATEDAKRQSMFESGFTVYSQIVRYLSHRILPAQSKKNRFALKRMAKRFGLIDGVLMYTRVSPPVRVARSREEVNAILQQFHDNQGHYGYGICHRAISQHFYWANMSRDVAHWISSCPTCITKTKRKWLRCSIYNCTNSCGPVERGLGLTFHKFPVHNPALLVQWLKSVGRPGFHPRLWSSVCSAHFTEDCFGRSGDKVTLRADAVPTLFVHSDSTIYFAKYDAVELYIRSRTYPPGLNFVEKNTFRTFCKKFAIKDDQLHMVRGDRVRLVLRSRQQVEAALTDYHSELNHLDITKCLRLLNERFFWKTMKADTRRWIDNCSQCSKMKKKKTDDQPELRSEMLLQPLGSPQLHTDSVSENDDVGGNDDDSNDVTHNDSSDDKDGSPAMDCEDRMPQTPISAEPRIPIIIHLRTPVNLQPKTPNNPSLTQVWPLSIDGSSNSKFQVETNSFIIQPESKTSAQCDVTSETDGRTKSPVQKETSVSLTEVQNSANVRTHQCTEGPVVIESVSHPHELLTNHQSQQEPQLLTATIGVSEMNLQVKTCTTP
ncbi:uncharacterized protein LOC117531765 isoform X2 [Thalassophryne amazonica]|uniref:uncharacterized protein LOC117531765 isoform X2 n=1 Tax=Thalassophryne amazonica TaxID=390379 RepID=UPI001471E806|nr:uncharacterized protein LOC117531765 isoform X2 [Thalassophryne amazonica]